VARILLVDDDDLTRTTVKEMLARAGHEVSEAVNGFEGLQIFSEYPSDLVVTDIFMPEKEGLSTIRDMRQLFPKVKIIAMSGGIWAMDSDLGLKAATLFGADITFPKPVAKAKLLAAVEDLLTHSVIDDNVVD
jgi:CheY-like chemotaxis protein